MVGRLLVVILSNSHAGGKATDPGLGQHKILGARRHRQDTVRDGIRWLFLEEHRQSLIEARCMRGAPALFHFREGGVHSRDRLTCWPCSPGLHLTSKYKFSPFHSNVFQHQQERACPPSRTKHLYKFAEQLQCTTLRVCGL